MTSLVLRDVALVSAATAPALLRSLVGDIGTVTIGVTGRLADEEIAVRLVAIEDAERVAALIRESASADHARPSTDRRQAVPRSRRVVTAP